MMGRYTMVTTVHECPFSQTCTGYDKDWCPMAYVVAEFRETVLVCPVGTYLLHSEDGYEDDD